MAPTTMVRAGFDKQGKVIASVQMPSAAMTKTTLKGKKRRAHTTLPFVLQKVARFYDES